MFQLKKQMMMNMLVSVLNYGMPRIKFILNAISHQKKVGMESMNQVLCKHKVLIQARIFSMFRETVNRIE